MRSSRAAAGKRASQWQLVERGVRLVLLYHTPSAEAVEQTGAGSCVVVGDGYMLVTPWREGSSSGCAPGGLRLPSRRSSSSHHLDLHNHAVAFMQELQQGLTPAKAVGHRCIFAMLLVNNEFILDKKTNQEEYKRFCLPDEYATCIHDPNPNRLQLLAVAVISLRRRWQKNTLDDAEPPSLAGDGSVA